MTDDADLQKLSDEIRNDINGCNEVDEQSLRKAVDLGAKLLAAKALRPTGGFQKWIEAQQFGVQYNWCAVCMRASTAAKQIQADERYSWEYIRKHFGTVKELAARCDKFNPDEPLAKPERKPAERKPTLVEALAARIEQLESRVAELEGADHG